MIGITVAILLALLATGARAGEQRKPFEGFTKYVKYHVRYQVNPDGTHVETHDWARKVLSDQGVSAANSASVSFSDRLDGVQVQALPKNVDLSGKNAAYRARYEMAGNTVKVIREFEDRTAGNVCEPGQAVDFKPFGASVLKDLRAQLVYQ